MPLFATVQPGITVADTTTIDESVLNRLGTPSVEIQGEVDGTGSVTIGAGTVTNSMLANMTGPTVKGLRTGTAAPNDVAIDDSTIEIGNTGSYGTIRVKDGGITTAKLATATGASDGVTYAKLQQVAASSLVGNPTGSLAAPQGITLGSGLVFSGTTLAVSLSTGVLGGKAARSTYAQVFPTGSTNGRAIDGSAFTFAQGVAITTDGSTALSVTYTPTSASSYLIVDASVPVQAYGNGAMIQLAVFRDASTGSSTASCVGVRSLTSNSIDVVSTRCYLPSNSTSSTTFKVRIASAGNPGFTSSNDIVLAVNGYNSGGSAVSAFASGIMQAVISVTEVSA
jgi:hypothetical protein